MQQSPFTHTYTHTHFLQARPLINRTLSLTEYLTLTHRAPDEEEDRKREEGDPLRREERKRGENAKMQSRRRDRKRNENWSKKQEAEGETEREMKTEARPEVGKGEKQERTSSTEEWVFRPKTKVIAQALWLLLSKRRQRWKNRRK